MSSSSPSKPERYATPRAVAPIMARQASIHGPHVNFCGHIVRGRKLCWLFGTCGGCGIIAGIVLLTIAHTMSDLALTQYIQAVNDWNNGLHTHWLNEVQTHTAVASIWQGHNYSSVWTGAIIPTSVGHVQPSVTAPATQVPTYHAQVWQASQQDNISTAIAWPVTWPTVKPTDTAIVYEQDQLLRLNITIDGKPALPEPLHVAPLAYLRVAARSHHCVAGVFNADTVTCLLALRVAAVCTVVIPSADQAGAWRVVDAGNPGCAPLPDAAHYAVSLPSYPVLYNKDSYAHEAETGDWYPSGDARPTGGGWAVSTALYQVVAMSEAVPGTPAAPVQPDIQLRPPADPEVVAVRLTGGNMDLGRDPASLKIAAAVVLVVGVVLMAVFVWDQNKLRREDHTQHMLMEMQASAAASPANAVPQRSESGAYLEPGWAARPAVPHHDHHLEQELAQAQEQDARPAEHT